jgi:outer membrane protein TolC
MKTKLVPTQNTLREPIRRTMIDLLNQQLADKLSSERYAAGKASYYEVLEAQQQLFSSELNLARTQRDQLLAVVSLYKALGEGWQDT